MKLASKAWLWGSILFLIIFVGLAVVSFSSSKVDRQWLNAPDWSRASLIGDTSASEPVPFVLDGVGTLYLFALQDDGGTYHPKLFALDRGANVVWERTLEAALEEPEDPRILLDGQSLHLFWLDSGSLYTVEVDTSGNGLAPATLLSEARKVASYDLATEPGGVTSIWYGGTRREPGVYALRRQDSTWNATLVSAEAIQPAISVDGQGTVHAVWLTYPPPGSRPQVYYAAYPNGAYLTGQETQVLESPIDADNTLQGPWLGLDGEQVYLFWIETLQTRNHGYLIWNKYVSFPLGQPGLASEPQAVVVPNTDELQYEPYPEGALAAGRRVLLRPGQYPETVPPSELWLNPTLAEETALALRADIEYQRGNMVGQIGTLFLRSGLVTTYQLLSFNPKFSRAPALVSDGVGQLYVTWLEHKDGPGYNVYFASTAPDIRQALSGLTRGDTGRMVADTFFGLLAGAVFFPVALLLWLVLPALLLAVTWVFRRGGETITSRPAILSIVLALLAYWGVKLVTFARARTYVPFTGWIPIIPSGLGLVLQLGLPLFILLVSLGTAWYVVRRVQARSALLFVIIYALVDSFLTMAVYGGLLYDAF
jgi:hypothetical protein